MNLDKIQDFRSLLQYLFAQLFGARIPELALRVGHLNYFYG